MSPGALVRLVLLLVVAGSILAWRLWGAGAAESTLAPTKTARPQHEQLEEDIRRSLAESAEQATQRTNDAIDSGK